MVGNTASYTTPQLHSCTIQLNNCSHTASCTVAQYTQFHICTVPQLHSFLHSSTDAPFHSFQHSYVAASQDTAATAVMQDSDSENKSHRSRSFPNLATCKHSISSPPNTCLDDLTCNKKLPTHVYQDKTFYLLNNTIPPEFTIHSGNEIFKHNIHVP